MQRAKKEAESNGNTIETVYVDCSEHNTHTRATRYIASTINNTKTDLEIPKSGIGSSEYYDYIWEITDKHYNSIITILDEIDKLDDNDILMQLSRAQEAGKIDTDIGIVAISNKIRYRENLGERIKSSLDARDYVFNPYNSQQLQDILKRRKDAFYEGVLETDVIPVVSALSAKEHGDARKAIEILKNAGRIAEEIGSNKITEQHVHKAKERAEMDRFYELIKGSTHHTKIVLYVLAELSYSNKKEISFTTKKYMTNTKTYVQM